MGNIRLQPGRSQADLRRRGPSPGMVAVCTGLILILLVGYAFSPCLTAELLIDRDDGHYIYGKGRVWGASWYDAAESFGRFFFPSETGGYYQPLTNLSYMLQAKIIERDWPTHWEERSFYFHLTNLVLHLLNVAVLFVLIRTVSGSTGWAFLLAAFFGLHPVQVTSVAWVSQQMTLLATFFALLAIGAYLRYATTEGLRWFFAVIVLTGLAILARPTFLALPIVFLVLDVWPGGRRGSARTESVATQAGPDEGNNSNKALSPRPYRALIEKLPLFLLMIWALGLHLYLHLKTTPVADAAAGGPALVAMNVASAVKRLLFPVQMGLFHPISEEAAGKQGTWLVLAGVLLIVLWAAWTLRSLHRNKPLFLALAGTVVWILPAMLDLPYMDELIGDAHLYVAFILPAIALATWLRQPPKEMKQTWGWIVTFATCGVVLLFGVRSFRQCYVWQNSRELYAQAIREYPGWPEGYLGLVRSFLHEAELDAALRWAERATEVAPDEPETQFMLGRVLMLHQDGRAQEAIEPLKKALASNPNWIDCLRLLGEAMLITNHMDEAEAYLVRARDLDPAETTVHTLLGEIYLQTQRPSSARAEFQLALKANSAPEAHLGLARAWAINGRPDLAARHLATAVGLDPQFKTVAATYPELLRLIDTPGFEGLIDATATPSTEPKHAPEAATDAPPTPREDAIGDEPPPAELPESTPNTLGA